VVESVAPVPEAPPPANGMVHIAISPWGQVEVDGKAAGTTPPLTRLELSPGSHVITVRNADFPPFTQSVTVDAERPVTVKHRFGS
jgi:serine/threonine-protein kinase